MLAADSYITTTPEASYSVKFMNSMQGFIAEKILTPIPVAKRSGKWYQWNKEHLRNPNAKAPIGTRAKQVQPSAFNTSYETDVYRLSGTVWGRDLRDADPAIDLKQATLETIASNLRIGLEKATFDFVTTASNYPSALTATLAAGSTWADAGGDPIADVRTAREAVRDACGVYPESMAISRKTLDRLRVHPGLIDRVKYTGPFLPQEVVASLLDLREIVVADATMNTAVDGASDVLTDIWTDKAVLFVRGQRGLNSMGFGNIFMATQFYTKSWEETAAGGADGGTTYESGWEWVLKPAAVESSSSSDFVAGYLIANTY